MQEAVAGTGCLQYPSAQADTCFTQDIAEVALRGMACRCHQSNKASGISPKAIKLLSELLKLMQYSQGNQTWSLYHDLLHSPLDNWSANIHHKTFGPNHSLMWEGRDCETALNWISSERLTSVQEEWTWRKEMARTLNPNRPLSQILTSQPNCPGPAIASPAAQLIQACFVQSQQAEFKMYFHDLVKLFCLKKHHFLRVQPLIQLRVIKAFAQVWTNFSVYRTDWINIPLRGREFITATA